MKKQYFVRADWDDEAKCWYVSDTNIPGLATGAATIPDLIEKLLVMVPELLTENEHIKDPVYFDFDARHKTQLLACA